jgi:hypothetical protein
LPVQACQDAHAQVVTWSSCADFAANSLLAFFMVRAHAFPCMTSSRRRHHCL